MAPTGVAGADSTDHRADSGKIVVLGEATAEPTRRKVSISRIAENIRSIAKLPAPQKPDGLLQMLWWSLSGPPRWPSDIKVETVSGWNIRIISAQISYRDDSLSLEGKVGRTGMSTTRGHLEVRLLDQNRRLIRSWKVEYFPRDLPNNIRGSQGRASYATIINPVPPKLASIVVQYTGAR